MTTAKQKYDKKVNRLKHKLIEIADKQSNLKTANGQIKQYYDLSKTKRKIFDLFDKKYNRTQNALNKLVYSRNQDNKGDYAQQTKSNLKDNDDHDKFSYLRVNNPQSSHSYVYLFNTSESPTASNNVSSEATEHGINRMTNTQMQPTSISVNGTIYNKSDGLRPVIKIVDKIMGWTNDGVEMCYSGVMFYRRCVITNFNPTFNTNSDGSTNSCSFSMSLQDAMYFDDDVHKSSRSVKHTGSKGRKKGNATGRKYVKAKRGDTYARIARKKGVKLSTVKSLNSGSVEAGQRIYY